MNNVQQCPAEYSSMHQQLIAENCCAHRNIPFLSLSLSILGFPCSLSVTSQTRFQQRDCLGLLLQINSVTFEQFMLYLALHTSMIIFKDIIIFTEVSLHVFPICLYNMCNPSSQSHMPIFFDPPSIHLSIYLSLVNPIHSIVQIEQCTYMCTDLLFSGWICSNFSSF